MDNYLLKYLLRNINGGTLFKPRVFGNLDGLKITDLIYFFCFFHNYLILFCYLSMLYIIIFLLCFFYFLFTLLLYNKIKL